MSDSVSDQTSTPAAPVSYQERLRTPWWWYLVALAVAILLGAEFASAVPGWIAWVPFALMVPTCLLVVWRLSSGTVRVAGSTLAVGDRTLPLGEVAQAIPLSPSELRRLVGRHSDPLAFNFIRSWVGPGIQFVLEPPAAVSEPELADDDDFDAPLPPHPEPYWLISTRHPDRVLAAVAAATPAR